MATLVMEFTECEVPVSFQWREPMSDQEFIAFSERNKPFRFERNREGDINVMTVGGTGSAHEALVGGALYSWNSQTEAGQVFFSNVGFNLPDGSCLSPVASWVSRQRWHALSASERAGFPPLCPEFLIEVRSRTDSRRALEKKMERWLENGARLAWLVDPAEGEVVIYRPGETTETLERPDIVRGHAPVDGFALEATPLWDVE